jgi:hypothetical protein
LVVGVGAGLLVGRATAAGIVFTGEAELLLKAGNDGSAEKPVISTEHKKSNSELTI